MKASEYLIYKLSDQMKASTKIDADLFKQKKVKLQALLAKIRSITKAVLLTLCSG